MLRTKRAHITAVLVLTALALVAAGCGATPSPTPGPSGTSPTTPPGTAAPSVGSVQLTGAGATFPLPVYTEWIFAYQYVDRSVTINYQGIGSGGGQKAILDKTVDFAGSDSLLKEEQYGQDNSLQMLPILAGAVIPIFNVTGSDGKPLDKLVLDGQNLVDIYLSRIRKWNDSRIAALNPSVKTLPDANMTVVHRSDGSGTTEIFTKYLAAVSADWKSAVGAGSAVEWPADKAGNGIGGKGNPGVAAAVQNTPNSIGYVELAFAVQNKIAYADMVNAAGQIVQANDVSTQSAMSDYAGSFSARMTRDIVNGKGAGSWPIAGYTYVILRMEQADCAKARKLLEFLKWALTDPGAANRAKELGYSVLPDAVRTQVLAKIAQVRCNGAPVIAD